MCDCLCFVGLHNLSTVAVEHGKKRGSLPENVLLCFLWGRQAYVPRNVCQRQRQVGLGEALGVPHLARCQRLLQ